MKTYLFTVFQGQEESLKMHLCMLSAKWRIFRKPIKANIDLVENIVKATLCLHNYLRLTENASYPPQGFVDSEDSSGNIIPGD